MKHTAGPWKIKWNHRAGYYDIDPNDGHGKIARINIRYSKTDNLTENKANARLIAAAPTMLEVLKNVVECETPPMTWVAYKCLAKVKAVIASIEGRNKK